MFFRSSRRWSLKASGLAGLAGLCISGHWVKASVRPGVYIYTGQGGHPGHFAGRSSLAMEGDL